MVDNKLLEVLEKGNLAIFKSDTVYGIHCDATNINAIKKVDRIKKSNKPHLILVSSINMLEEYILQMNDLQKRLIDKYWPNTLTILFKKNEKISDELTKGSEYIAIRIPNDEQLLKLISKFGKPLLSTSANISGESVFSNVSQINKEIKDNVSYIKDDGIIDNITSTIIKVENDKIIFLREGVLSSIIKEDFKEYI